VLDGGVCQADSLIVGLAFGGGHRSITARGEEDAQHMATAVAAVAAGIAVTTRRCYYSNNETLLL